MQGSGADHTERRTRPAWIRAAAAAQAWPLLLVAGLWIASLPAAAPAQALASAPPSSLYAWGGNSSGQIGAASSGSCNFSSCSTIPLAVESGATFTAVSGGEQYTLALDGSGRVWSWGDNGFGQLGDGSTTPTSTPQQLPPFPTAITQIAAGNGFSLALDASGTVWAWGNDSYGQLGNGVYGSGHEETTPTIVSGFNGSPIRAIAAGSAYGLALDATGNVWAWGADASGQLGSFAQIQQCGGSSLGAVGCTPTPALVHGFPSADTIKAIAAGGDHSLALDAGGQVWSWGSDSAGQLGNIGSTPCGLLQLTSTCNFSPIAVIGLPNPAADQVTALAAGVDSSLALMASGAVWAWGSNASGQLGFGFPPTNCSPLLGSGAPLDCSSMAPVQVAAPAGVTFTAIASGDSHSLALSTGGQVYAWGSNANGQLGNGSASATCAIAPTGAGCLAVAPGLVSNLAGMAGIGAGGQASFALGPAGYAPSIGITPSSIDFGHQATGTKSAQQTITIANTSQADVHIGSISVPPGGFLGLGAPDFPADASGCSNQTLEPVGNPGQSCIITVSFSPQATGQRSGTISINSDAGSGTAQTVQLTGYGDSPPTPTATATKVAGVTQPSTPTKTPTAKAPTATATRIASPTPTRTVTPTLGTTAGTTTTVVITPLPQPTSVHVTRPAPTPKPKPHPSKPTVRAPCGGKALTVTVGKSVAAGGALAVKLCAPERAKVVFTMQVTTKTVVVTGKGKKQKRTTHVSVQRIPLGVTVRKTVVIKKGKQRSTKVQTSVRYMTSVTVQSDAHGRLSTSFRVKDTPKKAEQAVLSATTHWSGKPVVRTAHVTVQPLHQHKGKPKKSSSTHH